MSINVIANIVSLASMKYLSICCSAGSGEYNVYMDDTLVASGGVFGFDVTEFFGNCGGDGQATSIRVDIRPDDNPSKSVSFNSTQPKLFVSCNYVQARRHGLFLILALVEAK